MNAKKISSLSDESIKKLRELMAQKSKIDQELDQIMGVKPRKPRQPKVAK